MKTGYDDFFKKAKKTAPADSLMQKKVTKSGARPKAQKRQFPIKEFVAFIGFSLLMTSGYFHFDELEKMFSRFDLSMSSAHAEASPAEDVNVKQAASDKPAVVEEKKPEKIDEADYLFKLSDRKKVLDQREEDLNKLAAELEKQKVEIDEKLKKLEETRTRISSVLEERIKADDGRIETLVQMYSNMKPQQAAKVFETMDEDLVIEILGRMKKKSAADILNLVKPEKAQVLAERYVGYRAPASQ